MNKIGRAYGLAGFWWTVLAVLLFSAGPALAQGDLIRVDADGPVDVRADSLEYDERTATYQATGEVEILRGGNRLLADSIKLDSKSMVAEASGNVRLITPGQILTGNRLLMDLNSSTGKLYNGQVYIPGNNFYLRGEEIEKTGEDTYLMNYGEFTTCDGSKPAWTVTGSEMDVTIEGYGTAKNTAFRIRDVPVLWSPYMAFPAKFKRQSGLLAPSFGTSNRDGFMYSQPYFQTLGDDMDATFTLTYMGKRGIDYGLEYRYNLGAGSKGMFSMDYLPNDQQGEELFKKGENAKPYDSRYWFRAMADQELFNGSMSMKVDIDLVSDEDYLREFTFGNTGWNANHKRYTEWFGREFDPYTSTTRESKLNILKTWSNTTFNGSMIYYDDLTTNNKATLQEFPYLSLDATKQAVGKSGLYFKMGSDYRYYYREEGSTGHVANISPQLSLPLNFNDFLTLEPIFTYMPRFYAVNTDGESNVKKNGVDNMWSFETKLSTYMFRVFDFGSAEDPLKVKHAFRPYVSYYFQPESDDDDIADLASRSEGRQNTVSYGIENAFTSKYMGQDETTGEVVAKYVEFMRLNFSHSFDLGQYRQSTDNHYWGELEGRLEFEPNDFLYAQANASWDPYENSFTGIYFQVDASDRRGDVISLDYSQDNEETHQIQARLKLAVTTEWSANYIQRYNFEDEESFETTYELRYEGQCWGVRTFYTDKVRERGFYVAFSLGGFGELFGYGKTNTSTN